MEDKLVMKEVTNRSIFRWIHSVFGIPILGCISPFEGTPKYAAQVRFVFVPVLLSGLWMWKGHALRRLISKRLENYSHENGTSIGGLEIQ
jgi:hypothetical protein